MTTYADIKHLNDRGLIRLFEAYVRLASQLMVEIHVPIDDLFADPDITEVNHICEGGQHAIVTHDVLGGPPEVMLVGVHDDTVIGFLFEDMDWEALVQEQSVLFGDSAKVVA